jgi:hypothetical protein
VADVLTNRSEDQRRQQLDRTAIRRTGISKERDLEGTSEASPAIAIMLSASALSNRSTRRSKPALRRGGMRDEEMLLLNLKWATSHPIRCARD